ncbi:hypothetical protein [Brevibacillus dissolubilis]|uniref:hypothetical protein n=1 Tax=Brevibacillus dissolubilis TaxID=1844116 RepID=UPI001116415E|nr:hypothetical protein [Brevibacillus dissolubilis]
MNVRSKSLIFTGLSLVVLLGASLTIGSTSSKQSIHEPIQKAVVQGTHITYSTVEELENRADLVVIGSPVKKFEEETAVVTYNQAGRFEDFYTPSEIKINEILKGTHSEKIIFVNQNAAITTNLDGKEKIMLIDEGYSVMEKGKQYLLFLRKVNGEKFSVIAVNQGKYNIDGTDDGEKEEAKHDESYAKLREKVKSKYKDKFKSPY